MASADTSCEEGNPQTVSISVCPMLDGEKMTDEQRRYAREVLIPKILEKMEVDPTSVGIVDNDGSTDATCDYGFELASDTMMVADAIAELDPDALPMWSSEKFTFRVPAARVDCVITLSTRMRRDILNPDGH